MTGPCQCGCMDRPDRFGNYSLCAFAEAWLEQQQESEGLVRVVADALVAEFEREAA